MNAAEDFDRALAAQGGGDPALLPDRLTSACAQTFGVSGVGLSFSADPARRLPLGASSAAAAQAERIQFGFGDGPCLAAQLTRSTVRVGWDEIGLRWPAYSQRMLADSTYRSVIAAPVGGAWSQIASLQLYDVGMDAPAIAETDLPAVADHIGQWLTEPTMTGEQLLATPLWMHGAALVARQRVWVAVGYLSHHWNTSTADALATLRAYALRHDRDLQTAADAILRGELPAA